MREADSCSAAIGDHAIDPDFNVAARRPVVQAVLSARTSSGHEAVQYRLRRIITSMTGIQI